MEGLYEVRGDHDPVGKAEVVKEGLYYRITCRYRQENALLSRLVVRWPDGWLNLGIPVPERDGFALHRKVPVKHLGEGQWEFVLLSADRDPEEFLFPKVLQLPDPLPREPSLEEVSSSGEEIILEDKPFDCLEDLEAAHLEIIGDQLMAVFDLPGDPAEIQLQSDGTVIGTQDLTVNGGAEDAAADTV